MSKRLVKVAKELNVGTKTIVEFLNGNGFSVSNKPTAKISDEMYNALAKNFQNSIAIKEQANQITIGTRKTKEEQQKEKLKNLKAKEEEEQVVAPVPPVESKTEKPVVDTTPTVEEKTSPKDSGTEKEAAEEKKGPQLTGPKILGKINLENQGKRGKKKKTAPKVEEKKASKEPRTPKVEVVKASKEKQTKDTPKEQPTEKAKVKAPVVVPEKKQEPIVAKEEKTSEKKETPKETAKDAPVVLSNAANPELDIKVEAPQLKGLKILGKINIASPKSKRKKKGKDNRRGGDSSDPKKKNLVASSEGGQGQKKRRKRTRVTKPSDSKTTNTSTSKTTSRSSSNQKTNSSSDDKKKTFKKPDAVSSSKRGRKKGKRKEIDNKEIDDKLKATMNLLSGRGAKKKKFGASRKERDEQRAERLREIESNSDETPKIQVTEFISVSELANLLKVSATEIIMACMNEKRMVSINQRMDRELIELMGIEFGYEIEFVSAEDQMEKDYQIEDDELEDNTDRSPIVTVMGHVDHGKTSLLDSIRKSNVAGGEAGGITQHIGAYEVKVGEQGITFLDTPGHEAFTAMRARGAKVTDVAVIIISADDSIMPQTKEAISHAQAAEVPIIFAINKIDKEGANPDRIKQELASMDLLIEEWGGKYQSQDISAKQGLNIDSLLEKILLESEMLELKANPEKRAVGTVLEASLEKGRGYVAKILVRNGTLSVGDSMVAGPHYGKVKAMFNERGKRVKSAGPATPVLVLGLQGAPQAGETMNVIASEKEAKDLAEKRANLVRQQQIRATRRVTLDDITNRIKIGNFQELNLIVKGDFDGSVEALSDSLLKLSTDQVQTNIIYQAVGPITESDVNLAAASNAIIVGFQVRPNPMAKRLAENEGVEINTYSIIYDAIDEIKSALEGMLEPKQVEEVIGSVDVQQVFKISKVGAVAGCFVQEGKISRNSFIRVIRDGIVEYPKKEGVHGELSSLRRFKDSVPEVKNGFECGLTMKNYNDLKEGDVLEVYEVKEVKQTLS
ncbi:MAG: Translation initiation factor 2 [uncultured Aureispira sp.]|uniref:Translation initiation factor IF-2 n=1 Tax=uncultured Aureispira sp. TaxID=1331704 RepID=A0A6S6RZ24_9BACT|nr:MAG: Translation initiation factor 2 [uncultured Aureispira sp.]